MNTNNIAMWVILQNNAGWDCFKTLIFARDLQDSKPTSGGTSCVFGSHTFVPISWMCKKQTSGSHCSTESENIPPDAGLRMVWTQKSKSSTSTPKTNLPTILTKGNFTRDEWNHLLCLFNISHFSSTVCSEAMAKRVQQDSGEERVTAKSRPMMSLIARAPSNISSSTSESPGREVMEIKIPGMRKLRDRIDRGNPLWAATQKPRLTIIMNNLLKALSQHATQSVMITKLGLLKSGKLTLRWMMERGNPL